ncbi:MAG TPA: CHAP domain-containing protein [Solirubrobacteraceae bacterium]|nr:CHAP domain-containing protein [Solirubrobacteraceae bacterium]
MSIDAVLARIALLGDLGTPSDAARAGGAAAPATTGVPSSFAATTPALPATTSYPQSFAQALGAATAAATGPAIGGPTAPAGPVPPIVSVAEGELGQAEQPPGSNDSPRIATYRSAVPGGGVGPWCAYFVSWASAQTGSPIGFDGQGSASVEGVWQWAQAAGRAVAVDTAHPYTPSPGDLIVWGGEHIGIVEAVLPDGGIQTIEGNSGNQVSRRVYGPDGGGATGYVRMG